MAKKTTRRIVRGSPRGQRVIIESEPTAPAVSTLDDEELEREEGAEPGAQAVEPQPDPDDDLACLPGEGFVRITRICADGQKRFLRRVDRDVISKDIGFIGRTWGGGTYQLEIFNNLSRWVRKITRSFDEFEYGAPKGPGVTAAPAEPADEFGDDYPPSPRPSSFDAAPPASTAPRPAPASPLVEMMREMREQNASHLQQIMQLQKENSQLMLETIKATAGGRAANPYSDVIETAKLMTRQESGGKKSPREEITELLQMFRLLKDEVNPPAIGEGGSFIERAVMTFGPKLVDTLLPAIKLGLARDAAAAAARRGTLPPKPKPVAVIPPKAEPAQAAEAPATDGSSVTPTESPAPVAEADATAVGDQGHNGNGQKEVPMKVVDVLKTNPAIAVISSMLLDDARVAKPVAETAERILAFVGDNQKYNAILDKVLAEADLTTYLAQFEPELASYGGWIESLKAEFFEEGAPEGEAVGAEPGSGEETPVS